MAGVVFKHFPVACRVRTSSTIRGCSYATQLNRCDSSRPVTSRVSCRDAGTCMGANTRIVGMKCQDLDVVVCLISYYFLVIYLKIWMYSQQPSCVCSQTLLSEGLLSPFGSSDMRVHVNNCMTFVYDRVGERTFISKTQWQKHADNTSIIVDSNSYDFVVNTFRSSRRGPTEHGERSDTMVRAP